MAEYFKERVCNLSGKKWKQYNSLQKCNCYDCREVQKQKPKQITTKKIYTIPKVSKTNKVIEKTKSLSDYKADLQKEINLIVRLIDYGHPCICNPSKRMKLITAGHYISVGANETLRFNLLNIYGQDIDSNGEKGGQPIEFKNGLISLFGIEVFEQIESLKSIKSINLTIEDLKDKISIARSIVKWLKLQERKFTTSERLELRIKFNNQLSIY
jgi:hypothetical protein